MWRRFSVSCLAADCEIDALIDFIEKIGCWTAGLIIWTGVPSWSNGAFWPAGPELLSGRTLPENADLSDALSWSNFEMLTLEIDHMTMNSAISSVIMSL